MANRWTTIGYLTVTLACAPGDGERGSSSTRQVLVSAAISLSGALEEIDADYERITGSQIVLNVAGSDTLATQIVEGAPVDLFLSADSAQLDRVAARGLVVGDTRVELLANQLVAIVPAERGGTVVAPVDLESASIRYIAIGDPDAVPAGVYAKAYLESVGLWETVGGKVVPTRNVRAALAAVDAGNADAGFVYRTDLFLDPGVRLAFEVPLDEGPAIRYPAAVLADAPNADAARRFLEYLQSPPAHSVFEQAGFIVLVPEGAGS